MSTERVFKIDLNDQTLSSQIAQVDLWLPIDDCGRLKIHFSVDAKFLSDVSQFPTTASFEWKSKQLFKGQLTDIALRAPTQFELTFSDSLYGTKKITENEFLKSQSLRQTLDRLCQHAGLRAKYIGSFDAQTPGMNLGEKTVYEHFIELSHMYGFSFLFRSPSESLHFIRLGEQLKETALDGKRQLNALTSTHTVSKMFEGVEVRYFDPSQTESKEKRLSAGTLYGEISRYTQGAFYREKQGWKLSGGRVEVHANDGYTFDNADDLLQHSLSKKLIAQDESVFTIFSPDVGPGEKLTVKNAVSRTLEESQFFVRACRVLIQSSQPKMEVHAIRP